jgi:mannosyltransferase OCH1-like enzyme
VIPKLFHCIWVQGEPPAHYEPWIASWSRNHPDWKHVLWSESDYYDLLSGDTKTVYDSTPYSGGTKFAQQSDIAGKVILEEYGGVMMCADFESLRPMGDVFDSENVVAWWETPGQLSNGIIGAPPHHPAVRLAVEAAPESVRRQRERSMQINNGAGPKFIHPLWHERGDVEKRPAGEVYPYLWFEEVPVSFGTAYAVHHWSATWK